MKHLTATEHGRLGYLTTSRSAKHNNGQIMSGAVSRELERLATKALGISPGPPTKAERHRPDTIRRDRPKQEVLFDTLEEDWMPETEPWETRFPSPVAAARRTDGLTTRFRAAPRKNYLKGPLSACKAAPRCAQPVFGQGGYLTGC